MSKFGCNTFEEYFELIKKRNLENAEDGHCPVFGVFHYTDEFLEKNKRIIETYWDDGALPLSPYKVLTFIGGE